VRNQWRVCSSGSSPGFIGWGLNDVNPALISAIEAENCRASFDIAVIDLHSRGEPD
jgi:hypothetical protein